MFNLTSLADYEKGRQAYADGNSYLYTLGSDELKAGYREAFESDLPSRYFEGAGHMAEQAWDQHCFDEPERVQITDLSFEPCGSARLGGAR